jgi:hypothetical protein
MGYLDRVYNSVEVAKPEMSAMNLLLLLARAIPLSCLALLVSLALLGVLTLGGIIHLIAGVARSEYIGTLKANLKINASCPKNPL